MDPDLRRGDPVNNVGGLPRSPTCSSGQCRVGCPESLSQRGRPDEGRGPDFGVGASQRPFALPLYEQSRHHRRTFRSGAEMTAPERNSPLINAWFCVWLSRPFSAWLPAPCAVCGSCAGGSAQARLMDFRSQMPSACCVAWHQAGAQKEERRGRYPASAAPALSGAWLPTGLPDKCLPASFESAPARNLPDWAARPRTSR